MAPIEHRPGDRAANSGEYEELNVFGTPTGRVVVLAKGDRLPDSAIGFSWLSLTDHTAAELRERASEYRRMAETTRLATIRSDLRSVADRFDILAEQRERR